MESFFVDKESYSSAKELILIIKTDLNKSNIEKLLKSIHSYDIPFIVEIKTGEPNEKYLRTQYIHNDGNDYNVLLNDNGQISGVIDFGDMAHTFLASELAVAITYLILEEAEPETKIKSVVQGFQSVYPLRDEEIESLIHLVCVRACFSVVTANYRKKLFPENKYISVTEPYAWTFLKNFADKELSNFKIY